MLLFIILVLFLSIPAVQTQLGKKATKKLNEEFGTNINIGKVGLQFNGDVELKNIYIQDYKKDTLININELNTSILSFKNLYEGKLAFGDIDIIGLFFNIKTYKDTDETNLDVFVAKFEDDNPRKEKSTFLFSSSDVSIYDSTFKLTNENKENSDGLNFKDLNINATNFLINGSDVSARINTLAFVDSRGLVMKNMTTNFVYTLQDMTFAKLDIKTIDSELKGDVKFEYKREDLQFFTDSVKVSANFKDANIALSELNTFYNEFGQNQKAKISVNLSGTLNNLSAKNLYVNTSRRTRIYGNILFKNLFNSSENNFYMNGNFRDLSSNYRDLKDLLPNVLGEAIPSSFDRLGNFTIVGNSQITPSTINAVLVIDTDLGLINSNLKLTNINDIDNASYEGKVIFDKFNIGTFMENPKLKRTSLNLDVNGSGFTRKNINTNLNGVIDFIEYNNYSYSNLVASGNLRDNVFNGKLVSNDINFMFNFDGLADLSQDVYTFDFVANVQRADLRILNFTKENQTSIFKGIVDMKMKGTNINDAFGDISFNNTYYKNDIDEYFFKDFQLTSRFTEEGIRHINVNSPDITEGYLSGKFLFEDIGNLFENALGSIYTNYVPYKVKTNQYIDFNFKIYNKIVEIFYPELELGKNTFIRGRVESDEKGFKLTFRSPKITLFDYFADNIEIKVDNKNPLFNTYIDIDSIKTKYYNVSKFNLINVTLNDTLFMRSEFKGGKSNKDMYNLSFYHTINKNNQSVVGFKKSDITFKNNTWFINELQNKLNKVTFDKSLNNFNIDEFVMNHNNEEIKLLGIIKDSTYKDIKLNFKDVDLAKITPPIDSLSLAGNVNGKLDILQNNGVYLPNSSVTIDDFIVNDYHLGSFDAKIKGNESLTNYVVDISIKDDIAQSFKAFGNINVVKNASTIDVDLDFNDFNLEPLNPFGQGVISNIRGIIDGRAKVVGSLKKPDIIGQLTLNETGLSVPYLNIDYQIKDNSKVKLEDQSFIFDNVELTDTAFNTKGLLDGYLNHDNLSEWALGLTISSPRILVLNTEETEESLYYGTGFLGGSASIIGPTEELVINVTGETEKGTVFKIPLNDTESFGDNSFIHFLTPEEKRARLQGKEVVYKDIKGLELDFNLDVTEDAEIELLLDKNTGSTIVGRGIGGMLVEINTNGKFNIYGDFSVFEGVYNFLYGGVVQKKFIVEPGGTLAWEGNPMNALINIKAIYETTANPSPLLDNPINRSIPVKVGITLSGQLAKPEPDFSFEFPTANSTVRSELQYRLDSKDERDNQALYLLTTGSFSSGLNNINPYGTLTERLTGIVNSLFTNNDNKLQVGINYENAEKTPEYQSDAKLGLNIQTRISDRVLINGNVGVPIGGVSETVIAGDVEIDFLLNEDGTLTAKVFNRENSIQNFGEEIGYTQGVGISYTVEFDTFKELIQKIVKSSKKKEENIQDKETNIENTSENPLPDFVNFKSDSDAKN
ncbi:translocation/assembly module TamB domain-containing protein [Yeosuana sp. MJ-SS3]|uniref:Translocation/assembly module TamB domain-containing protein n=1 Tax=Gilvirhabdus luticola TaxID=3079858 RepID=A0ABU3U9A7_9FLAO|nr:translocation/assembly module TamB domain-containing protein [Yeosuana sp. MJ-SS3]MDU8887004.1 translocation/assembly module TamB domain-containing protein [Yeosuana sp. MJ-SS3]